MKDECKNCGNCCKHIAIEIDVPDSKGEYEDIYWYLLHENVRVFVTENDDEDSDDEESWFVEFITRCKALDENNLCKIYTKRPRICAEYDPDTCVQNGGESEELMRFNNAEEFLDYLKKEKAIDLG
ncbi:MAG: YkgJ family cysteine cluster protein [Nanoarchaeota archaeon]